MVSCRRSASPGASSRQDNVASVSSDNHNFQRGGIRTLRLAQLPDLTGLGKTKIYKELNAIAPDTPVLILHLYDGALPNRGALRTAGCTKHTPAPVGGKIVHDRAGSPTGPLLAEPKAAILYAWVELRHRVMAVPAPSSPTRWLALVPSCGAWLTERGGCTP